MRSESISASPLISTTNSSNATHLTSHISCHTHTYPSTLPHRRRRSSHVALNRYFRVGEETTTEVSKAEASTPQQDREERRQREKAKGGRWTRTMGTRCKGNDRKRLLALRRAHASQSPTWRSNRRAHAPQPWSGLHMWEASP